jgi:siroheme synthase-like protein
MRNSNDNINSPLGDGGVNKLFPIFLKLENLRVLLIGAGNVALEKLQAIVNNAPKTKIKVVAKQVHPVFAEFSQQYPSIEILTIEYNASYLDDCDIVISAVNNLQLSEQIRNDAKQKGKLINAADKPELCDFYLGSIVTKGNLKLAISTNGKSPTVAKRLKEIFNELLPEELDEVLNNIQQIRETLKGDFQNKVHQLNEITKILVNEKKGSSSTGKKTVKK